MDSLRKTLRAAAVALTLALPPLTFASPAADGPGDDRRSLEDLLKEVEAARATRLEELKPEVARVVEDLDLLRAAVRTSKSAQKQRALEKLGPEAAPLMVPFLDPGKEPSRAAIFRSELVAEVLADLASPIVTDELLKMAREGSVIARLNALTALATSKEPGRVVRPLVTIADGRDAVGMDPDQAQTVREKAFATLAAVGTPVAMEYIQSMLAGDDVERASAALKALQAAPLEVSADAVLQVLKSEAAPRMAGAVASYYGAHEVLLEDFDHARYVGEVAIDPSLEPDVRIELFDLLRINDARVGTPVKRRIDDYTNVAKADLRNAALMLMARMKDRGARRTLLEEHDDRIKENRNDMSAHGDRAVILHAIGDYSAATKDWREVMRIMKEARIPARDKTPFLGIARSLARQKKFREAKEYLEKAPISLRERQALAQDRDFREMLDSRYRDAFLLDE
ncbi:MAG: hypothetical protein AAGB93_10255 [Planctomycetota bacterium]